MEKLVYVGYNGFPTGFAQVQRQLLIAKGLTECGISVTVLSRYPVHDRQKINETEYLGIFEGINYKYCSKTPYRSGRFIWRNLIKLFGFFNEAGTIISLKKEGAKVMLINTNSFANVLFYTLLGKVIAMRTVIDIVEHWSDGQKHYTFINNANLLNYFSPRLTDKVIVISRFLEDTAKKVKPSNRILVVPALVDFSKFNLQRTSDPGNYLLYCGSAGYYEVIEFIIDCYSTIEANDHELFLVCNGSPVELTKIQMKIASCPKAGSIYLTSELTYEQLVDKYINSAALLIPLRPTLQDMARFPHKIGEYCASRRPIITTDIGIVSDYFQDHYNAYIAKGFDIQSFSLKIAETISDQKRAETIGQNGYDTGLQNFDYRSHGERIRNFIFNAVNEQNSHTE